MAKILGKFATFRLLNLNFGGKCQNNTAPSCLPDGSYVSRRKARSHQVKEKAKFIFDVSDLFFDCFLIFFVFAITFARYQ